MADRPKVFELAPGALVRVTVAGIVGEYTGRVARLAGLWALEVDCEGALGWWTAEYVEPAYEEPADGA